MMTATACLSMIRWRNFYSRSWQATFEENETQGEATDSKFAPHRGIKSEQQIPLSSLPFAHDWAEYSSEAVERPLPNLDCELTA